MKYLFLNLGLLAWFVASVVPNEPEKKIAMFCSAIFMVLLAVFFRLDETSDEL